MDNIKSREYFGLYFPQPSVSESSLFFFFDSLRQTTLGAQALKVLSKNRTVIKNPDTDSEGLKVIRGAMAFLEKMIQAEQLNERNYFTENIINNDKLPEEMKEECQKAIGGKYIDYKQFIITMNKYYDGAEQFKKNLMYEIDRLDQLKKLFISFRERYTPNIYGEYTGIAFDQEKQQEVEFSTNFYGAFRNFLQRGVKEGYLTKEQQEFGFNTKTIANLVQSKFQSLFNEVWNEADFQQKILPYVMNGGIKNCEKQITADLLLKFVHKAAPQIVDLLKNENDKGFKYELSGDDMKTLVDKFLHSSNPQNNNGKEVVINQQLSSIITDAKKIEQLEKTRLINSTDRVIKAYTNKTLIEANKNGGLNNLSSEIIELLESILRKRKKITNEKKQKLSNQQLYKALTDAFPGQELRVKGKYNWEKMSALINKLIENKQIIGVKFSAKDNIISESMNKSGLQQAVINSNRINETILTFGIQKADVSSIEIADITISKNEVDWGSIATEIVQDFVQSLQISKIDINTQAIKFNEEKFRKDNNFGDTEFSIEAETLRRLALKEQEIEKLQRQLKKAHASADTIQQIISSLKNSVQIGSTVKSYNKYENDTGFHGGSLGGTVESQLKNLYKMFEYGEVDLPKIEWMTFAIYNSGPALLGSDLREPLEDILSTVAVMLLFDDAGQQAVYLNQEIARRYNIDTNKNNSKFLHLYNLNGVYYPASFILQLTYNSLLTTYSFLDLDPLAGTADFDAISNGSRVKIENPVSEMLEVGTVVDKKTNKITTEQSQWVDTFSVNRRSVSINITFLAGMLDIIKILNSNLKI